MSAAGINATAGRNIAKQNLVEGSCKYRPASAGNAQRPQIRSEKMLARTAPSIPQCSAMASEAPNTVNSEFSKDHLATSSCRFAASRGQLAVDQPAASTP